MLLLVLHFSLGFAFALSGEGQQSPTPKPRIVDFNGFRGCYARDSVNGVKDIIEGSDDIFKVLDATGRSEELSDEQRDKVLREYADQDAKLKVIFDYLTETDKRIAKAEKDDESFKLNEAVVRAHAATALKIAQSRISSPRLKSRAYGAAGRLFGYFGRVERSKEDGRFSIAYLREAIKADPTYEHAWAAFAKAMLAISKHQFSGIIQASLDVNAIAELQRLRPRLAAFATQRDLLKKVDKAIADD